MTTQQKIEKKGYRVTYSTQGNLVFAEKMNKETGAPVPNTKVSAPNITQLLKKL